MFNIILATTFFRVNTYLNGAARFVVPQAKIEIIPQLSHIIPQVSQTSVSWGEGSTGYDALRCSRLGVWKMGADI